MKVLVMLFGCMMGCAYSFAQQNLGVRNSNYAGIQGALLNPSSIADSKLKWDINALSVGEVFANTFLYAPKSSLHFFGIRRIIKGSFDEDLFATRYAAGDPNKLYNLTLSTEFLGPAFFMTIAKKHLIGFTFAARAYANIKNIPGTTGQNAWAYFLEHDLWNTDLHDYTTKINSMGWLAYGLHYATVIWSGGRQEIKGGISLNYLQGIAAAYAKNTRLNYRIADTTGFLFTNSSVDYGRTDFSTYKKMHNYGDLNHGHGFGMDAGITYVYLKDLKTRDYLYRVGLSLLDIGSVNFNRHTASYHLQTAAGNFSNWHQTKFADNAQVDRSLSAVFYNGDSSASFVADHFRMGLPSAVSLQADWNVCRQYFANITIIKGFGHGRGQGVVRPDVYSFTPRYETKWLEISLPMSLLYYDHWQPRLGLAVRAWYFFIGGDALGPLFKINDLKGVDFYAGIHYFMPEKHSHENHTALADCNQTPD